MVRLVGAVVVVLASNAAHADCVEIATAPHPLAAQNALRTDNFIEVDPAGGVLVGLVFQGREGRHGSLVPSGWRLKQPTKLVEPVARELAPSLAVYDFAGPWATLLDERQRARITVRRGATMPPLPAPVIKAAILDHSLGVQDLTIKFGKVPASALGVIVYQGDRAVNWDRLVREVPAVLFRSVPDCRSGELPGTSVPTSGAITVAWFDAGGRVSKRSPPVAIKPAR